MHLTFLSSLWGVHTQLTQMETLILTGDECYFYIAKGVFARWLFKGVFQKVYLIGGLEIGMFKTFIST